MPPQRKLGGQKKGGQKNSSTEKRQIDLPNAINGTLYLSVETPTVHRDSVCE